MDRRRAEWPAEGHSARPGVKKGAESKDEGGMERTLETDREKTDGQGVKVKETEGGEA